MNTLNNLTSLLIQGHILQLTCGIFVFSSNCLLIKGCITLSFQKTEIRPNYILAHYYHCLLYTSYNLPTNHRRTTVLLFVI